VRQIILIEGTANVFVLLIKVIVGLSTGSLAIMGDALHSITDVANNVIAWFVIKFASQPADREHPYGHRKFETLAVFGLATFLSIIAFELALRAFQNPATEVASQPWELALMVGVLIVNFGLASWQRYWARKLDSEILLADASHTFGDVLTTIVVIAGWQFSAMGYVWLDRLTAIGVSGLIFFLAYKLFKRVVPVLVDEIAIAPEELEDTIAQVKGVREVRRVRSRWIGSNCAVDVTVAVDANLPTKDSHQIADNIEDLIEKEFNARDISVHIETVQKK
jgi:cation diffusion facilitator family transporter